MATKVEKLEVQIGATDKTSAGVNAAKSSLSKFKGSINKAQDATSNFMSAQAQFGMMANTIHGCRLKEWV